MQLASSLARLTGLAWIVWSGATARADDAADFYRGRTITLIAGFNAPASETSVCVASPASAFKTIDDALHTEMVTGTAGTSTYDFPVVLNDFPVVLNNVLGTKLKLVKG